MTAGDVDQEYGRQLRAARRAAGYRTQEELADAIGRSQKMVQHYEAGKHLTPDVRASLERVLGQFAVTGDPVEVALDRSGLEDWRASDVKTLYKRHWLEQRREETG